MFSLALTLCSQLGDTRTYELIEKKEFPWHDV